MTQWVKDPALSLQWLGPLLWRMFNPWPRNFHMPQAQPGKKKKSVWEEYLLTEKIFIID